MSAEEAHRHGDDASNDQDEIRGQCHRDAGETDEDREPQHLAPPEPARDLAGQRRTRGAGKIDHEDRADRRLAEFIGRREQPEADIVVYADEAAHQQERLQEQPG